ncbi:hypothetical protein [Janthinobacterium svalbardensis]|uniref:hypothetical protein n=1 Tax=Janthinobacterium svalbardensis TaxID=368607 RepID=UPI002FCD6E6C
MKAGSASLTLNLRRVRAEAGPVAQENTYRVFIDEVSRDDEPGRMMHIGSAAEGVADFVSGRTDVSVL